MAGDSRHVRIDESQCKLKTYLSTLDLLQPNLIVPLY